MPAVARRSAGRRRLGQDHVIAGHQRFGSVPAGRTAVEIEDLGAPEGYDHPGDHRIGNSIPANEVSPTGGATHSTEGCRR